MSWAKLCTDALRILVWMEDSWSLLLEEWRCERYRMERDLANPLSCCAWTDSVFDSINIIVAHYHIDSNHSGRLLGHSGSSLSHPGSRLGHSR